MRMAEQVASALRERILAEGLRSGSVLPKQEELVTEFGVSYPSVREALRILETEGLITIRRGNVGGAEVHAPDATTAGYALGLALQATRVNVADLGEALTAMEPLSVARCARRADRAEKVVPVLRALLAASEERLDDGVEFTVLARRFHDALMSFNDNATQTLVLRSLTSLWSVQEERWAEAAMSAGAYPALKERRRVQRAHTRITDAIEDGDHETAARVTRTHLGASQHYVLPHMKDETVDAASPRARAHYRALGVVSSDKHE
jgi:DNA-binding FadR family transcriptional regulator